MVHTRYESITTPDGAFDAFCAVPEAPDAPAVLVFQEVFGINDNIRGLAGRLSPRLSVAASPLLVWLACIGVFGLAGPGGDQVLIEDWRSLLLLACGALPAAVVIGGPRPRA